MVEDQACRWPVARNELGECGKPAVGEAEATDPAFRLAVCQEHLDQSRRGAAADDQFLAARTAPSAQDDAANRQIL